MNSGRIFVVDDERTIRLTFRHALETDGYEVHEAGSADEARMAFKYERYDLVVLDLRLGGDSGLDVLAEMRENGIKTPTLMITAYGSIRSAVRAMQLGAIDFLEKPVEPGTLRAAVTEIVRRHRPTSELVEPGTSPGLLREAKRLINLQNFDMASRIVAEALGVDDRSADAHNLQGVLHEIAGNYDDARKSYGHAIALVSNHPAAQQNMRRLYELFNFGSSRESLHFGVRS